MSAGWRFPVGAQPAGVENLPPHVSIVWPPNGSEFSSEVFKIKANATAANGSIAEVQFFAEANFIGKVTNPPFNIVWQVQDLANGSFNLKAVAVDNLGARVESAPVRLYYSSGPPAFPIVLIDSPRDGTLYSAPATFVFSAELLASEGDAGPVEFFIDANSAGLVQGSTLLTAATPPSSVTVSDLPEGEYKLSVRYRGANGVYCTCNRITNTIRVVKLGLQSPSLTPDGHFKCEVVTSFPGRPTVFEVSTNLQAWMPISTNQPQSNAFTFTDSCPANNAQRFYRVLVPSENP